MAINSNKSSAKGKDFLNSLDYGQYFRDEGRQQNDNAMQLASQIPVSSLTTDVRQAYDQRLQNYKNAEERARTTGYSMPDGSVMGQSPARLSALGNVSGFLGDVTGATVNKVTPEWVKDSVSAAGRGISALGDTPYFSPVKTGLVATGEAMESFSKAYPQASEDIGNMFNIATALVGGSQISQGVKAARGSWAAGMSNYIKNFYGNDNKDIPPTPEEIGLGVLGLHLKGVAPSNKGNVINQSNLDAQGNPTAAYNPNDITKITLAGKRLKGIIDWGKEAPSTMLDALLNPNSKALYAGQGISAKGQQLVKELLAEYDKTGSTRFLDKAAAQVTYNRHIIEQSNRSGGLSVPLLEIDDFNNIQSYAPHTEMSFRSGALKTRFNNAQGKKVKTPIAVIDQAHERINKAWGNKPDPKRKVVFKEPNGRESGNHFSDLASKYPANKHIRDVITGHKGKGAISSKDLYTKLKAISDKTKEFSINTTWKDAEKHGIWVNSGMVGSSVVEGGVNGLMKILPNGRAIAFMSDKHDFLEKVPYLGKVLEKTLPNELMAISGPIHMDIMGTKYAEGALAKVGKVNNKKDKYTTAKRAERPKIRQILDEYVNASPTSGDYLKGYNRTIGTGLMATTANNEQ